MTRAAMAAEAGLTTAELAHIEDVCYQIAATAIDAGLDTEAALQLAADAGIAATRTILQDR